jgi:vacuolar-type H+-ATPase subunit I/STV1
VKPAIEKRWLSKYLMRITEITTQTIKPKPPMTPAQSRINTLKQNVDRSKQQLNMERERQRQQRETERKRKAQQRPSTF